MGAVRSKGAAPKATGQRRTITVRPPLDAALAEIRAAVDLGQPIEIVVPANVSKRDRVRILLEAAVSPEQVSPPMSADFLAALSVGLMEGELSERRKQIADEVNAARNEKLEGVLIYAALLYYALREGDHRNSHKDITYQVMCGHKYLNVGQRTWDSYLAVLHERRWLPKGRVIRKNTAKR